MRSLHRLLSPPLGAVTAKHSPAEMADALVNAGASRADVNRGLRSQRRREGLNQTAFAGGPTGPESILKVVRAGTLSDGTDYHWLPETPATEQSP